MQFIFPLMLWIGLGCLALILALYCFKRRCRERRVSALFLWRSPARLSGAGRKLSPLEASILLFLEILAACCLIAAAAIPSCSSSLADREIVAVLDSSASMSVPQINENTRKQLFNELSRLKPFRLTLIYSGRHPRVAASGLRSVEDVRRTLDSSWICDQDLHDFSPAFSLASQLCSKSGLLFFFTDSAPSSGMDKPAALDWRACGSPLPNYAITAAVRRRDTLRLNENFFIQLSNFSPAPAVLQLSFYPDPDASPSAAPALTQSVTVPAHESVRVNAVYPRITGKPFLVRLSPGGALSCDDSVLLLSSVRPPLKAALDFRPDSLLLPLLRHTLNSLSPLVEISSPAQLVFTDSPLSVAPPSAWKIFFPPGDPEQSVACTDPFVQDKTSPLLRNLPVRYVRWSVPPEADSSSSSVLPLLSCGKYALLAEGALPSTARSFVFNYIPARSNVHKTPVWPILFHNLVSLRISSLPGFESRNLKLNESLHGCFPSSNVLSFTPVSGGDPLRIPLSSGVLSFTPEHPGVYRVNDNSGQSFGNISVSFLSPSESDFSACSSVRISPAESVPALTSAVNWHDDSWMFLLAALLLLTARSAYIKYREVRDAL